MTQLKNIHMIAHHLKKHFHKHRKLHAVLGLVAILGIGVYFAVAKQVVHSEGETAPNAPTITAIGPGNGAVSLTWVSNGDGGSPITQYQVESTLDDGSHWVYAASTSETRAFVNELTNGTAYKFRVIATNAIGQSEPSAESEAATPFVVNDVSLNRTTYGDDNTSLTVEWPDALPGTYAIDYYHITMESKGTREDPVIVDDPESPHLFTGLTPGNSYSVRIGAVDVQGNHGSEFATEVTMPGGGPGPIVVSAELAGSTVHFTWTTDPDSDSRLAYGLDPNAMIYSVNDRSSEAEHSVTVDVSDIPGCTAVFYKAYATVEEFEDRVNQDYGNDRTVHAIIVGDCRANIVDSTSKVLDTSRRSTIEYGALGGVYFQVSAPDAYSSRAAEGAVFQLKQIERAEFFGGVTKPTGTTAVSEVVDAKAYSDRTDTITAFDKDLDVSMTYDPTLLGGANTNTLAIWRLDDSTWTRLSDCSVNESSHLITCKTDHFSAFTVLSSPASQEPSGSQGGSAGTVSGGASTAFQTPIVKVPAPTQPAFSLADIFKGHVLKQGDPKNDRVALLQILLTKIDPAHPLMLDGIFGTATKNAVLRFQGVHALRQDGVFGSETRAKVLESYR